MSDKIKVPGIIIPKVNKKAKMPAILYMDGKIEKTTERRLSNLERSIITISLEDSNDWEVFWWPFENTALDDLEIEIKKVNSFDPVSLVGINISGVEGFTTYVSESGWSGNLTQLQENNIYRINHGAIANSCVLRIYPKNRILQEQQ